MPKIRQEMYTVSYEFGPGTDVSRDMASVGAAIIESAGAGDPWTLAVAVYRAMNLQKSFESDPEKYLAEHGGPDTEETAPRYR